MQDRACRRIGIFQVALSGLFFGVLGVVGKSLFKRGMTPGELLSVRYLLAAAVLWPVLWWRHPRAWKLGWRELATCAALGIGGYALFSSCFFLALQGLSASLAVLLLYTYPMMVTAFAWIFWGERLPARRLPALPLALTGTALLVWGELSVGRSGALWLGLGAAVFYSGYILASSRWLARIPPLVSVTYVLSFAGLALGALHLRSPGRLAELWTVMIGAWPLIALLSGVGTLGAMSLFLAGLQKLKPWEVSLLSTLEPLSGVALAAIVLGERLSWAQGAGALGVLGGLIVISLPEERQALRPQA